MAGAAFHIGLLLFPRLTQLDLTGPYEVFARMPGAAVNLLWKTLEPVQSDRGLAILPTATLETCPPLDLLCVPGGPGVNELLTDADLLAFLRRAASRAKYVTSVCSGSLVLGAAGLLRRRRAGSHWMSREMLRSFGAEPVDARTVVDGNVITGGGVTAGIDLALQVVAEIAGRDAAEAIQLAIEYDPRPPFDAGSPSRARQDLVRRVARAAEPMLRERAEQVRRAAAALDEAAPPR
ncbi:MAG: thiamine biosynthesis protein ThiJ [Candidatus Rokuibacteriota bacterium]|nr:MAG: thiamine biosynthesis protein ThiJ [Candidatus Rokubacteria bacterium]